MEFDLVIQNGVVIDGTGKGRFAADLGILNGRIAAVAAGERLQAARLLDAHGLVVAPGFIDLHSHADWILPLPDHDLILAPLLQQGITTVVGGNCGFSPAPAPGGSSATLDNISDILRDRPLDYQWHTFQEFQDYLCSRSLLLSTATLVGHGTLRALAMGKKTGPPDATEMEMMRGLLRAALRGGAVGMSAGLAYSPGVFTGNDELLTLLKVVADEGKIFTVHGRAYTWVSPFYKPMFFGAPHNLRSVRELIALAQGAGVRLELSHQIFVGRRTWRTYPRVLEAIEQARQDGLDIGIDAFPYTVGNSTVKVVFPEWFLDGFDRKVSDPASLRKLKREITLLQMALGIQYSDIRLLCGMAPELAELEGLDFSEIASRLNLGLFDAYMYVARLSRGEARILLDSYSGDARHEEPLQAVLKHPLCSFMTDTILTHHPQHNPASFGTYPRLLGRYCRDLGLFSLEEAVRRSTSFPAARIGLRDVGLIAPGAWADLVLFDPQTIADRTTPTQRAAAPQGIHAVLVGGEVAVQEGTIMPGVKRGRVL